MSPIKKTKVPKEKTQEPPKEPSPKSTIPSDLQVYRSSKDDLDKDFRAWSDTFEISDQSPDEVALLENIKKVIETLDNGSGKGFANWNIEELVRAREKLSRYSEPLGEWITSHETKSDFAYIWRKGQYAKDWQPVKTILEGLQGKSPTVSDIEKEIDQKYLSEQFYSMFHRRRADLLIRELESVDRMLRSIDHRIRELSWEKTLKYD